MEWVKKARTWCVKDWENIISSNESMFQHTQKVWGLKHEKFYPAYIDRCAKIPLGVMAKGLSPDI